MSGSGSSAAYQASAWARTWGHPRGSLGLRWQKGFDAGGATVDFGAAELAEFQFGDVFGQPGASNWRLNLAGLRAGDAFSISAAVPEPESVAMLLAGLGLLGMVSRRRG